MRALYEDAVTREKLVATAFKSATEYFSRQTVGQIIQTRLTAVAAFNRPTTEPGADSKVCHIDALTEQRLKIIETGEDPADTSTPNLASAK